MPLIRPSILFAFAAGAATVACSGPTGVGACTAPYAPAVEVVPVDSLTGAYLAPGATGTTQMAGAQFQEPMATYPAPMDSVLFGGYPAGTYDVTVDHAGYLQWVRANMVVPSTGTCNVPRTVRLRARMQPAL